MTTELAKTYWTEADAPPVLPDEQRKDKVAKPPDEWIYRNLTPWRIEYRLDANAVDSEPVLTIPALGEVRVSHKDCKKWNTTTLRQRGQLEVVPAPDDALERLPSLILLVGWAGIVLTALVWAIIGGTDDMPLRAAAVGLIVVPALALGAACARELVHGQRFREYREQWPEHGCTNSTQGLNAGLGEGRNDSLSSRVSRAIAEALVLIGSLAVAVLGPALAIYYTSQLREVLPFDFAALLRLDDPFAEASEMARDSGAVWQLLVGHVAQWVLVSVAALVPAAMYFQFDRERLAAIQGRWVRQVFRLDPTVRSLGDIQAKYGAHMESSFGVLGPASSTRQRRGRRSPVIVATVLITIGWVVLTTGANIPQLEVQDGSYVWPGGRFPVADFFRPQGTALGFAFLGAYLFALFHIVRAYQRRDLVPKSYNTIVVRFLAAYILTLAAEALYPGDALHNPALIGFAFFAGFLPQSALVRLREFITAKNPEHRKGYEVLDERAPLTELEGIDLYDRTRLAEEGVNNVHALAHADIVELMSSTRIPADRLVDWTDQAILFLRVGGDRLIEDVDVDDSDVDDSDVIEQADATVPDGQGDALSIARANMRHLRRFGIRNASDLLQAFDAAVERGKREAAAAGHADADSAEARAVIHAHVDQLRLALSSGAMGADPNGYLPIQGMLDTLPDEEWFTQIRNWRWSEFGACDSWCWYVDGRWPYPSVPTTLPDRVSRFKKQQEPHGFGMVAARTEVPKQPE